MARFLVAGGAGFLGSAIIRWCLASGHSVRTIVRHPEKLGDLRQRVEVHQADVLDATSLAGCADGIDYATYSVVVRSPDPAEMVGLHLRAVGNVLDALDRRVRGFALASGTSVYEFDDGEWHDEQDLPNATGPVGRLNIASEGLLFARYRDAGFPGTVVRITGVYGAGRMNARALREGTLTLPGDGSNWTNRIHVDDAAQAMALAAMHGQRGAAYIAVDDTPVRLRDLMDHLVSIVGGPGVAWRPVPADASQLSMAERMMLSLARSVRFRNEKAKRELGFRPRYPSYIAGSRSAIEAELAGTEEREATLPAADSGASAPAP